MWSPGLIYVFSVVLHHYLVLVCGLIIPHSTTSFVRSINDVRSIYSHTTSKIEGSSTSLNAYPPRKNRRGGRNSSDEGDDIDDYDPVLDEPGGRRGDAKNWIEKTSPTGIGKLDDSTYGEENKDTDGNYDLGINGISFAVGDLSTRMYETLMSVALKRFPAGTALPSEMEDVYKLYAMDITAKEAVKAALNQNGLELAILDDLQDEGSWGDIDTVQLIDFETGEPEGNGEVYDSLQQAVEEGDWVPGQAFNFVVRSVPSKLKEMDLSDILKALDPDGQYKGQLKEQGFTMPDEDIKTLRELSVDCGRRVNIVPGDSETEIKAFVGDGSKGYAVMNRSDLLKKNRNPDGSENTATLMHVMDAFVNHGCLIVDLCDDGSDSSIDMMNLSKMWQASNSFFESIANDVDIVGKLPDLTKLKDTDSLDNNAGFKTDEDGYSRVLETRIKRSNNGHDETLIPSEIESIIGKDAVLGLLQGFQTMSNIGKDLTRIAIAAANMEYGEFEDVDDQAIDDADEDLFGLSNEGSTDLPFISGLTFEDAEASGIVIKNDNVEENDNADASASNAAVLLVDDLIDDGSKQDSDISPVCMSSQRIIQFEGDKRNYQAQTDTSFVTIVPVADVSALEVFDESADNWLRPEKLARNIWEAGRKERGLDENTLTEIIDVEDESGVQQVQIPWYNRYIVVIPGQLIQMCTRNEVQASVYRMVANDGNIDGKLSCPVLLRGRAGVTINSSKFFGANHIYKEIDGMSMEKIHDSLQL